MSPLHCLRFQLSLARIDGKPAFEAWKEYAGEAAKKDLNIDLDQIQDHSKTLAKFLTHYEAGLYISEDTYKIRWPGSTTTTKGPITFATSIPEGTVFKIMTSVKENQITSARHTAEIIKQNLKGTKLAGLVIFDCVVRALILQDDFKKAVASIRDTPQVPLIGLETYGEFAMEMNQMTGFHNTTTVILAIPE